MPGLGKSGTWRMRVLRVSIWLSDLESCCAPAGGEFFDVEQLDARRRGAAPHRGLEPIDRGLVPFRDHLDAAVDEVAHPAVHPFARRGVVREPTEPDALHAAGDHVTARHSHVN